MQGKRKRGINQTLVKSYIQFLKFGAVGLSNTMISYAVYSICLFVELHYIVANTMSFFVSVINAFYWNNKYVFQDNNSTKRVWWKVLFKCIISYSFSSLLLTSILLYLWVDKLSISPYIGQIINLFITIPLNFVMNKLWAFK